MKNGLAGIAMVFSIGAAVALSLTCGPFGLALGFGILGATVLGLGGAGWLLRSLKNCRPKDKKVRSEYKKVKSKKLVAKKRIRAKKRAPDRDYSFSETPMRSAAYDPFFLPTDVAPSPSMHKYSGRSSVSRPMCK